ncbi:MAG TPA: nitronate monooxygenase [Acidobacteriaceae bacterium]|nr:nitronate monooxygenase [Acidobacteriaceae bacterium]
MARFPTVIQGGMGVGISDWRLARAVSELGQLGVVSGTALDVILARRLQDGDKGGHTRRALDAFPFPAMAQRVWERYFIRGGRHPEEPYRSTPMHGMHSPVELVELCIVGNFVEVWLAREGHTNAVGINYLEKIQLPHLPSLYGAMLAGVDYVLMGAGIPIRIPGALDALSRHEAAMYPITVAGEGAEEDARVTFDPREHMECDLPPLKRPGFLAIVASATLAATLAKKANGRVDGFVVEGPAAGGHNAPPRGREPLSAAGEPVYGVRDEVDLAKIRELGLPFWLAGGFATAEKLAEALHAGAAGVQIGTAFAFCEESGLRSDYKRGLLQQVAAGTAMIFTDPCSSPTGFPFKTAMLAGTNSEARICEGRARVCDIGLLRSAYRMEDGRIGFRCPAEPVATYVAKGGTEEQTRGRKCLCNCLLANAGLAQVRSGSAEQGLVTAGDDLTGLGRLLNGGASYHAADVLASVMPG